MRPLRHLFQATNVRKDQKKKKQVLNQDKQHFNEIFQKIKLMQKTHKENSHILT